VDWLVSSADGHPITNTFGFAVDASAPGAKEGSGEPIREIEQSAKQAETGLDWGFLRSVILGLLLIGALAAAGVMALRRRL